MMTKLNYQHRFLSVTWPFWNNFSVPVCWSRYISGCVLSSLLLNIFKHCSIIHFLLSHVILLTTNVWAVTFITFIRENECPLMVFCRMCFSSVSLWWAQHRLKTSEPRWVLMGGVELVLIEYKHGHTSISLQTKSSSNQQQSHAQ